MPRIELGASSLPRKRSTPELHRLTFFFQKKARFKRIANVNIYFFKQNKLYFFLIRKQTYVNPYFWGVFF